MPIERKSLEKKLLKEGFIKVDRDHRYYFFNYPELNKSIFTKISTGSKYKTLGDSLVADIAKQLKLSKKMLEKFVRCEFGKDKLIKIYNENELL